MKNLEELQKRLWRMGMFSGNAKLLKIELESEFEGFYGLATENWNKRVTIETQLVLHDDGWIMLPSLRVKGRHGENIDDVAKRVLEILDKYKNKFHELPKGDW